MIFAYHLSFHTPVHFGIEGIGQESIEQTMRSDSLWGAILQNWFLLFNDEPEKLCCNTPFSISSCFPLIKKIRFFPLPVGAFDKVIEEAAKTNKTNIPSVKEWKQVRYIGEPIFKLILEGENFSLADIDLTLLYPMQYPGRSKKTSCIFMKQMQRPKIMTDQLNGGVNKKAFVYCTDQYFSPDSGLFFLTRFQNDHSRKKFEAALQLLGDTGVGGDRSTGRGSFSFTVKPFKLPNSGKSPAWITLSLYHPTRDEVANGVLRGYSKYSLVKRSGSGGSFHVNRFKRATCWMLTEGSIIPFKVTGDAPCVLRQSSIIPHNIYRNGRAFCVPFSAGVSL